jgi:hypothetical protein
MYRLLAEHRRVMFDEGLFVDLFPSSTGRPSVPGEVAASVLVLANWHTEPSAKPQSGVVQRSPSAPGRQGEHCAHRYCRRSRCIARLGGGVGLGT